MRWAYAFALALAFAFALASPLGCATTAPPTGVHRSEATPDEGLPLVVPAAAPLEATMAEPPADDERALNDAAIPNVGCVGPPSATALMRVQQAVCCYWPPVVFHKRVMLERDAFRACYQEGLRRRPELRGRVAARFTVEEDGSVVRACDAGSSLPDPATVRCVLEAFTQVRFEAYVVGEPCPPVTVVYPLSFQDP